MRTTQTIFVFLISVLIGTLASAHTGPKTSKKKSYPDIYFHCETRTNDGRETPFQEYGPSFELAQEKAIASCMKAKGRENCYPAALCIPISINTPVQCAVAVGREYYSGYGVDEDKAESAAKRDCLAFHRFETCLTARLETCRRLKLDLNFDTGR